jgi:TRAP-type C4-dicarboxylate transport system permease small subunit
MNNFVAKIFGALLSGLHLTVLLFLAVFIYYAWEAGSISSLEETSSNIFGGGIFITLVFFILYVIFIGLITVIVSIRENIVDSRKLLETLVKQGQISSDVKVEQLVREEPQMKQTID